jgi:glutamine amidotransferase
MTRVALMDYGVGNLHSLGKALERGGATVQVTRDWTRALTADALVLPGVGAFSAAVAALPSDPTPVREALAAGLPCLGICLGMQLLFDASDEGEGRGIGLIPGRVRRLRARMVPQMGWNDIEPTDDDPLFAGLDPLIAYYANSFVCEPDEPGATIARTTHEGVTFSAAVRRGRTWGVQFHPEKSSAAGQRLIANFLALAAEPRGDAAIAPEPRGIP